MPTANSTAVRAKMCQDLEAALVNDEFHLLYQPVFDLEREAPCGAEALLRWRHPDWDELSPRIFVPAAEAVGMTFSLGERVLELACNQGVDWLLEGQPALELSTNITKAQLYSPRTAGAVARILAATGFPAASLVLEAGEADLLGPAAQLEDALDAMAAVGVRLAIDDYGSTAGSLALLCHPAVAMVKLAPSLFDARGATEHGRGLVAAVVAYARVRGLKVVAKGMENAGHLAAAMRLGVTLVQGYGIGEPQPSDRFSSWRSRFRPQAAAD